jgi:hypothetical protein
MRKFKKDDRVIVGITRGIVVSDQISDKVRIGITTDDLKLGSSFCGLCNYMDQKIVKLDTDYYNARDNRLDQILGNDEDDYDE